MVFRYRNRKNLLMEVSLEIINKINFITSNKDRIHDRTVNKTGRQREKSGLYKNSRDGCKSYRVIGINDKY